MTIEIQEKIEALIEQLKKDLPKNASFFALNVNSEGYKCIIQHRHPEELENTGISMKNIAGEWIK